MTVNVLAIVLGIVGLALCAVNARRLRRNRLLLESVQRNNAERAALRAERAAVTEDVPVLASGGVIKTGPLKPPGFPVERHPRHDDGRFVEKRPRQSVTPEPDRSTPALPPTVDPLTGSAAFPGTLTGSYNPPEPTSPAPSPEPACDPPAPAPSPSHDFTSSTDSNGSSWSDSGSSSSSDSGSSSSDGGGGGGGCD